MLYSAQNLQVERMNTKDRILALNNRLQKLAEWNLEFTRTAPRLQNLAK